MRPGLIDWRDEEQVRPRPLRRNALAQGVDRHRHQASPLAAMAAIGPAQRCPGHHQHLSPASRRTGNPFEQRPPLRLWQAIMPKDYPAARGQAPQRLPQRLAHPLIGHQPDFRQVLPAFRGV